MEALWILIGLLLGGLIVYFLTQPLVKRAESQAAAEILRATGADESRQKLEVEISALREVAARVGDLAAQSEEDRAKILS